MDSLEVCDIQLNITYLSIFVHIVSWFLILQKKKIFFYLIVGRPVEKSYKVNILLKNNMSVIVDFLFQCTLYTIFECVALLLRIITNYLTVFHSIVFI